MIKQYESVIITILGLEAGTGITIGCIIIIIQGMP